MARDSLKVSIYSSNLNWYQTLPQGRKLVWLWTLEYEKYGIVMGKSVSE